MKATLAAAVVILSSLLAPHASAAPPIRATLTLPYDNVLPGVPFDLVVTYTNVSDKPVTIEGALATLVVTFANGETMVMHKPERNDQSSLPPTREAPLHLAPGESGEVAAGWDYGSIPNWFIYPSFSAPGTYGIALELRVVDEEGNALGTLRTPTVTLARDAPLGIDAELWKRMQEVSGGKWADMSFASTKEGVALASEIIKLHPGSRYYPYVLALRAFRTVTDKNDIPLLLEAAERFASSPAYPYLLNAAANCARYQGWIALEQGNVGDAKKHFTLADKKYREALATRSVGIRLGAQLGLLRVAEGVDRAKKPAR